MALAAVARWECGDAGGAWATSAAPPFGALLRAAVPSDVEQLRVSMAPLPLTATQRLLPLTIEYVLLENARHFAEAAARRAAVANVGMGCSGGVIPTDSTLLVQAVDPSSGAGDEGMEGGAGVGDDLHDDRVAVDAAADAAGAAAAAALVALAARATAAEAAVVKLLCLDAADDQLEDDGVPPRDGADGGALVAMRAENKRETTKRVQALLSEVICHLPSAAKLQLLSTDALEHFASLVGRHVVRPACALLRDACGRADGRRASHIARALVRGVRDLLPPTVPTDGALYGDRVAGGSAGVGGESATDSGAQAINGGELPREAAMPEGSRGAVGGEAVATDAVCVELALDAARRTVQLLAEGNAAGKREAVGALTALWGVHATFREELVTAGLTRALVVLLVGESSSGSSATSEGKAGRAGAGGEETMAEARTAAATLLWAMSTEGDGAREELHRRGVPVALARQLAGIRPVLARVDAVGCLWSLAMIPGVAADVVAVGGAPPLVEVVPTPPLSMLSNPNPYISPNPSPNPGRLVECWCFVLARCWWRARTPCARQQPPSCKWRRTRTRRRGPYSGRAPPNRWWSCSPTAPRLPCASKRR